MTVTRTIELDDDVDADLRSFASFAGMTPSETMHEAIASYLFDRSGQRAELQRSVAEAKAEADAARPQEFVEGEIASAWMKAVAEGGDEVPDLDEFVRDWRGKRTAA